MAIRDVVTRGFGNGTYSGTIPLVALRGYGSAEVTLADPTDGWTATQRNRLAVATQRTRTWITTDRNQDSES